MSDEVILAKAEIIGRCLKRIHEEYANQHDNLFLNQTKQDAIILNLERVCQATIDLAIHIVRTKKMGLPRESKESFDILEKNKIISTDLSRQLMNMVGFRNTVIHEYQKVDLDIVEKILTQHLQCLRDFSKIALKL